MGHTKFFTPGPSGEDYAFNRDAESREDVREYCEFLWERFRPLCPDEEHFLQDARVSFHARTWEMNLACALLSRGYGLERPPQDGPDIKIVSGPSTCRWPVWIEATIATLGQDGSPDHAGRIEHPFVPEYDGDDLTTLGASFAMLTLKPEKTTLRYTNALASKNAQLAEFRARNIVGSDDIFVVAINGALLDDYSSNDSDPEILKSVYPIGEAYFAYRIGEPYAGEWGHQHRGYVSKASGAEIPTTAFVGDGYSGVSAILYSRTTAWQPNASSADYMLSIHNARATNPLPNGFFAFGREAILKDGGVSWVQHPRLTAAQ